MNLNKHLEFISPTEYDKPIHIVGVGAIGSRVAEVLVRLGFSYINIYDFDIVEDANITNQLYTFEDIGKPKVEALNRLLSLINPHLNLTAHGKYTNQQLSGAVFLCVDSIELRKDIIQNCFSNRTIDVVFDLRMRLTDGQGYAAIWNDPMQVKALWNSMQFKDSEDLTPVSVCGTTLSVAPTILTLVSYQIMNFISYIKENTIKQVIFTDVMLFTTNAFNYK